MMYDKHMSLVSLKPNLLTINKGGAKQNTDIQSVTHSVPRPADVNNGEPWAANAGGGKWSTAKL
jgi:hypothetical protein